MQHLKEWLATEWLATEWLATEWLALGCFSHYLECSKTFPECFAMRHSSECLATLPRMFKQHSPECLAAFSGI